MDDTLCLFIELNIEIIIYVRLGVGKNQRQWRDFLGSIIE
jgi:hypothetical protein